MLTHVGRLFVCFGFFVCLTTAASAQQAPYYLRSTVGAPWGSTSNEAAMDAAFGAGNWVDERYETVNTATLFSAVRFIFMEGSDDNADELEAFIGANLAAINAFLTAGGVIFFNAAPNEGDGMGLPDGSGQSVVLSYPDSSFGPTTTAFPAHPIFNGPLATSTAFTASAFGHATISGAGLTSLLDGTGSVLAQLPIGLGLALYGGMTTTNFHSPQPDADNLRANILVYGAGRVNPDSPYYLRSTVGAPWNQSKNEAAMDAAFGAGNWVDERYETVSVALLLSEPRFIFMEGGDDNADELEAFIGANLAAINAFLTAGGVIFFNAAPNEGNGMGLPDGSGQSVVLTYPDSNNGPTSTTVPAHPIFNGPLPTSTAFTASSFGHATISGGGVTSLLDGASGSVLSERGIGLGHALYGGMTTTNFHSPQPDADNLRANILSYGKSRVNRTSPYYLRSTVGAPWGQSTNEAAMDAAFGAGNWVDERYETVDTATLFSAVRFIFMEGGNSNADEMEAFIGANLADINAFLTAGGVIFFNSAPNEGNGMGLPDGSGQSVVLTFPDFNSGPTSTAVPAHPIFNGPLPTSTALTGSSFGHATISGGGVTSLLDGATGSVLSERGIGLGLALYGGMTTTNFHNPQPAADNLRANILFYGKSQVTYSGPFYLRSTVGSPWNQTTNEAAMDAAFGAGSWVDERYETVGVALLLSEPRFIFMEGSDTNADELEAFIGANLAAINTFLTGGGVIFFNAAPNEGDGMGLPDGSAQSIVLTYPIFSNGPTSTAFPAHPIFNGPLPTSTAFTAGSFGHATISGAISLLDGLGSVLAERRIGSGLALYGGMTTTNFHSPQPDADNLRANILSYGGQVVMLPEPSTTLGLCAGLVASLLCAAHRRRRRGSTA